MRAFAFGVVVGALVCFAGIRVTGLGGAQTASPESMLHASPPASDIVSTLTEAGEPESSATAEMDPPAAAGPSANQVESLETPAIEILTFDERTGSLIASESGSSPGQRCISLEGLIAADIRSIESSLQYRREEDKKKAEPKDESWAYPTEMMIRQYIESRMLADQYKSLEVDCRTTYCLVQLTGAGEKNRLLADELAKEISSQPWSDIALKGYGRNGHEDDWHVYYEWFRPRTEPERRLWGRIDESRRQR